ncbi:hypothetical protein OQA88_10994 [Cercophora sp. LCS_1]
MTDGVPVPGSLWVYAPNKIAPACFGVAFLVSAIFHIWQCRRYKAWKLVGLHPVCAVLFTIGYALREYGSFNYIYSPENETTLFIFILSQVFIYVCPPLLELANYHVLGRIFYYIPFLAPLPPGRVLATFGGLMALVEVLNAVGVALVANPSGQQTTQHLGKILVLVAIALQVLVILIFVALAGLFHRRCAKKNVKPRAAMVPLWTLYASMTLIFVRCMYRLVEHTGNTTIKLSDPDALRNLSPLLRYEWYFYVFEASLMLVNSFLWNIWHPGRFLRKNVHLDADGLTEVHEDEKADQRPLLAKVGNVATFGIFFRNKAASQQFHQLNEYPSSSQ